MAYAQPPQPLPGQPPPPGPQARPPQVAAAVSIQLALAAVLIVTGAALIAVNGTVREGTVRWLESGPGLDRTEAAILGNVFGSTLVLEGIAWMLIGASHAALGVLNHRGAQPARILSWILAGLSLAGCGLGSLTGQVGFQYRFNDHGRDRSAELADAMTRATPAWVSATEFVALVLLLLGSLAVILLLVTGEANRYFHRRRPPRPAYPMDYQYTILPRQYQRRPPGDGPADPSRPPGPER